MKTAEDKRPYRNGMTKTMRLKSKYEAGCLKNLDRRTKVFDVVNSDYLEFVGDLGGLENLSLIERTLVERLVFIVHLTTDLEKRMVLDQKMARKLFRRWRTAVGVQVSISKALGLEKRASQPNLSLKNYVKQKKQA